MAAPDISKPHGQEPKHFERARANQLWQTDLFTFVLKRENRRVHLVGFLDDHSRFLVGYGLQATASGALVRESFLAAVAEACAQPGRPGSWAGTFGTLPAPALA